MSYNGEINFGLLGDYDVMYDLDEVVVAIEESTAELVEAAEEIAAAEAEAAEVATVRRSPKDEAEVGRR